MKKFFQALTFLTVLPGPRYTSDTDQPFDAAEWGRSAVWYPAVGLIIGIFLTLLAAGVTRVFPNTVAPVLVVIGWAWITGGLHLDGLADCCDGLFASVSKERRLEIMRDPRMGAFGGIGLVLMLLLKTAAIASTQVKIAYVNSIDLSFALLYAPVVARFALLLVAKRRSARPGGMGDAFARGISPLAFIAGAMLLIAVMFLDPNPLRAAGALAAALAATAMVILFARSRLGGMTGDVLGLSVEISEVAVLLVYASRFGAR